MKLLRTFVLVAICPLMTKASVITSGTIIINGVADAAFNFSGSGFSASGVGGPGSWLVTGVFSPGATVSIDAVLCCNDFEAGNAIVGRTNFPVDWGALNAGGPSVFKITGPPITLNAGPTAYTYQSTFTFSGALCGTSNSHAIPDPCVVDMPSLTGSGFVTAEFQPFPDGRLSLADVTYTFTNPEPGTWMLAGAGIVGAMFARRLKMRSLP